MLTKFEALETLRVLAAGLRSPVWLTGGLGADFLVGRWTRDHGDIDLVTFEEYRKPLDAEFGELGFTMTGDRGWITNWTRSGREWGEVSLGYVRRMGATTGALVFTEAHRDQGIVPGVYPGVDGDLDVDRFATLEGLRFRVESAEGQWVYATGFQRSRPGASDRPSVRHNLSLLESVLDSETLDRIRPLAGRRLPLDVG